MAHARAVRVRKVSATSLRGRLKTFLKAAKGGSVVLIENRRQESKYLVDKDWLDALMRERESFLATLEILADRELTARLLKLAQTVDEDVRAGRIHTMKEVFDET
jgi:PHD/YefM family antitoxin component YafN of YafNO toxin-antitoxin module